MRKLSVTWGKVVVFSGFSGAHQHLKLASHNLVVRIMAEHVTIIKNRNHFFIHF